MKNAYEGENNLNFAGKAAIRSMNMMLSLLVPKVNVSYHSERVDKHEIRSLRL
jgi:hypothetical protein